MLTRYISSAVFNPRLLTTTSSRLFSTSASRLGDGDHTKSKAKDKASDDLKSGREKRWLDTVASDSEAAVKGDKQHATKQGDFKKDMTDLQRDTIEAVNEKQMKGHLPKHDVGRRDTREERVVTGQYSHLASQNSDLVISLSAVLGAQLVFNLDKIIELNDSKNITWYKGGDDLKRAIFTLVRSTHSYIVPISSRYVIVNQTKLLILRTLVGDEGFYTFEIKINSKNSEYYFYHVILFTQNLSLSISLPSSSRQSTYHAGQQINFTCSISLFADRTFIERFRSTLLSTWYMTIYSHDSDRYELSPLSSNSYSYAANLLNYDLDRNDHNQHVSCMLLQQEFQTTKAILNTSLPTILNVEYKAYLRGNYYFTRSFNSYSLIEINCEEFDGNPKPVYTLIWFLNGENQTLLNQSQHGRYFIENATWHQRGHYMCLAENYLNYRVPAHQSFRLNIWFNAHQIE
ncbi:unnamed protein product [Adineta ricciae]|uniref:Ig-like domain-containing protein n=1 Tax=Adineta ricciae TaxID=249248 RepID=A0A815S584_ADIRI|nr:unnamed protein product [Adineta ricciae]